MNKINKAQKASSFKDIKSMEKQVGFGRQCSYSAKTIWSFGRLAHITMLVDYHIWENSCFVENLGWESMWAVHKAQGRDDSSA